MRLGRISSFQRKDETGKEDEKKKGKKRRTGDEDDTCIGQVIGEERRPLLRPVHGEPWDFERGEEEERGGKERKEIGKAFERKEQKRAEEKGKDQCLKKKDLKREARYGGKSKK